MFLISIKREELPLLSGEGVNCRINGKSRVLTREGDNGEYLCYDDGSKLNRCRILDVTSDGKLYSFTCASHGAEREPHAIVKAGGIVAFNCEGVTP